MFGFWGSGVPVPNPACTMQRRPKESGSGSRVPRFWSTLGCQCPDTRCSRDPGRELQHSQMNPVSMMCVLSRRSIERTFHLELRRALAESLHERGCGCAAKRYVRAVAVVAAKAPARVHNPYMPRAVSGRGLGLGFCSLRVLVLSA